MAPKRPAKGSERGATAQAQREAAAMIRRVLAAVEADELQAPGAAARVLVRRLEGAAAAWEATSGASPEPG